MKMKHVILRRVGPRRPLMTARAGIEAVGAPGPGVSLEFESFPPVRRAEIAKKKGVDAVAPVIPMKLVAPVLVGATDDQLANGSTWGVKAVGADISVFSGKNVVVAVLDTGIDPSHPAFAGVTLVRKNFTSEDDDDLHGHGTHCAGTIAGRAVDGARIGVAPGIEKLVIGKVLGEGGGGSDVLLDAIDWAIDNGAHVISMSLGIDFPGFVAELRQQDVPIEVATSMALEGYRANVLLFEKLAAFVQARSKFKQPCVLVAAAGNESRRDVDPEFEIAVGPPAVADGVVSVAALGTETGGFTVAPFSNVGARLCGPGVGVLSAQRGGGLIAMSGTSMATPHVAGVAALWIEKLQSLGQFTAQRLIDLLAGSGTMVGLKPGFDAAHVGTGMVRAPQN